MTLSVWPIFMAAPFIDPSTVTMRSAVSRCWRPMASSFFSGERTTFAVAVPAARAAVPAASPPSRAIRPTRDLFIRLLSPMDRRLAKRQQLLTDR